MTSLERNPEVTGITEGVGSGNVTINGKIVGGIVGTAGQGFVPLLDGRRPPAAGDDEIGLGVTTMRQVGARIGSVVDITVTTHSGAKRTEPYQVVSQISFPQLGGFVSLGTAILHDDRRPGPRRVPTGSPTGPVPDRRSATCAAAGFA